MTEPIKIDLGIYDGRNYWLRARAEPGYNNPDWFMVTVYYKDQKTAENVQIARVDCSHKYTHFDRLYKRGEPKDPVGWTIWETIDKFRANWRTYAKGYKSI